MSLFNFYLNIITVLLSVKDMYAVSVDEATL